MPWKTDPLTGEKYWEEPPITSPWEDEEFESPSDIAFKEEQKTKGIDYKTDLSKWYQQYLGRDISEEEWGKFWEPKTAEYPTWEKTVRESPEAQAYVPGGPDPEVTPPWEDFEIPYMGEYLEGTFEPEKTELITWLEETIGKRAVGEGIEQLTPEKIEEFRPFVEQIMQPRYQQEMRDQSEKWRAAGRAIDTEKLESIGRLSIQHNAETVAKMIGLAKDEVDRINFEMGRAIGQGLTLAQMEQVDMHLSADQKFQLNMYKIQTRDNTIAALQNVKIKDYYIRLARAWDEDDWDKYVDLCEQIEAEGQPDFADYLLSFLENIAPVVGYVIGGPPGGLIGEAVKETLKEVG